VCVGKANLPDLHLGLSVDSSSFGRVKHPLCHALNAVGSSGGVAAAVAAGVVPFGIGTDTGGCLRIPASLCGVVGFRPTFGRWPCDGFLKQTASRDTMGPIARTVADVQLLDAVVCHATHQAEATGVVASAARGVERLTGKPLLGATVHADDVGAADLRGARIGVPRAHYFDDLHSGVADAVESALEALRRAGAVLVEVSFLPGQEPWLIDAMVSAARYSLRLHRCTYLRPPPPPLTQVGEPLRGWEILREVSAFVLAHGSRRSVLDVVANFPGAERDRTMLQAAAAGTGVTYEAYRDALTVHRPRLQAAFDDCFTRNNVVALVYPTAPLPVVPLGQDGTVVLNGRRLPTYPTYTRNTAPTGNAGLPAVSLPAGYATVSPPDEAGSSTGTGSKGGGTAAVRMPVGLEFAGRSGCDEELLRLARAAEAVWAIGGVAQ